MREILVISIHETIRSHEQFSDRFVAELRNHLPAFGKVGE